MRQQIYGETIQLRAPAGFNAAVSAVARRSHTTASEFIRRAVLREIEDSGVHLPSSSPLIISEQASNR